MLECDGGLNKKGKKYEIITNEISSRDPTILMAQEAAGLKGG